MTSKTLILSSKMNNFCTEFNPPIHLSANKIYEAALLSIDTYYSFPNITTENNNFKYYNGQNWKTIKLDTGSYEVQAINDEIQRQMVTNNDYSQERNEFYITISANTSKLKSVLHISNPSYNVDFSVENSIGPTLGFNTEILNSGYHEFPKIVDIMKINSILVNVDIISGSYVNGMQHPVIYSFFPNVAPGRKIVERPNPSLSYYPVNRHQIDRIMVWLTDQDNKPVDLRGETVTIRLELREVQNTEEQIINGVKQAIKQLKKENIL